MAIQIDTLVSNSATMVVVFFFLFYFIFYFFIIFYFIYFFNKIVCFSSKLRRTLTYVILNYVNKNDVT